MFNNLFGKKETPKQEMSLYGGEIATLEAPQSEPVKSQIRPKTREGYDPVILQIHNEFKTSADNLLAEALKIVNETKSEVSEEKVSLLRKHGFSMSNEVLKQDKIDKKTSLSKQQIETITYYKQNYPFNKFIFPEQVEAICKKYNLVFGQASDYKGFVPEKNLKEIDNFKLKEEDYRYCMMYNGIDHDGWEMSFEEYKKATEPRADNGEGVWMDHRARYTKVERLRICAPIHDMNTRNKRVVDGYKLEDIPLDPVVLHPVRGKGFLVLTAWGDEASDPIIQNEILN